MLYNNRDSNCNCIQARGPGKCRFCGEYGFCWIKNPYLQIIYLLWKYRTFLRNTFFTPRGVVAVPDQKNNLKKCPHCQLLLLFYSIPFFYEGKFLVITTNTENFINCTTETRLYNGDKDAFVNLLTSQWNSPKRLCMGQSKTVTIATLGFVIEKVLHVCDHHIYVEHKVHKVHKTCI